MIRIIRHHKLFIRKWKANFKVFLFCFVLSCLFVCLLHLLTHLLRQSYLHEGIKTYKVFCMVRRIFSRFNFVGFIWKWYEHCTEEKLRKKQKKWEIKKTKNETEPKFSSNIRPTSLRINSLFPIKKTKDGRRQRITQHPERGGSCCWW